MIFCHLSPFTRFIVILTHWNESGLCWCLTKTSSNTVDRLASRIAFMISWLPHTREHCSNACQNATGTKLRLWIYGLVFFLWICMEYPHDLSNTYRGDERSFYAWRPARWQRLWDSVGECCTIFLSCLVLWRMKSPRRGLGHPFVCSHCSRFFRFAGSLTRSRVPTIFP